MRNLWPNLITKPEKNIKMKKTYAELREIDEIVGGLYIKNPKTKDGKFGYGYGRFYSKNAKSISEELNEKIMDSRIENAMVDEKTKELLYDLQGGGQNKLYKYTKEGMKKFLEETRKITKEYDEKEIEIIPFFVKEEDLPEMSEEEKELLKGCLIKE